MDLSSKDLSLNDYLKRTRKGLDHSTKAKNPDKESEKEIRQ